MKKYLLDCNIILRLITKDNLELYQIARTIFNRAENNDYKLIITPIIVAECVYVLSSKKLFNISKEKIFLVLKTVFNQKNIILEEFETIFKALEIFVLNNMDFADCYLLAKNQVDNLFGIQTFDKKIIKYKIEQ
jgi:predicted nucleic-acid-binding protein